MQNAETTNTESKNANANDTTNNSKNNTSSENSTEKIAINTSSSETSKTQTNNTNTSNKNEKTDTNKDSKNEEKVKDPEFKMPVNGDIMKEFADNKLVYSATLDIWATHNGIDIQAEKTSVVKASAEGTITSIKNDPRYGLTVIIEHVNGYKTVYANLLSTEFVKEGEKVEQKKL